MSSSAENTRSVVIEKVFPHSPEKLWRALTESPLIAQWLLKNDFEPVVGRSFQFRADPMPQWNGLIDCEVLVVEPAKRLSYTWASMGLETVVLWTLTPSDGGTHVRLEQSGFGPEHDMAYKGATYGWRNFIANLEKVVTELR
ncbi:MAG TPA: SRPBCC domain-containing protein [Acidobacteriaceae bacterium]|jgi:uncharacterized protein YndB with AHSA1/START domain